MNVLQREFYLVRKSSLARNAGWVFAGQGASFILQAAYFVLLARLLGTKEYGLFAGVFAFVGLSSVFSTVGSGTLFIRYVAKSPQLFSVYWGNILCVTFATSGLLIALQIWLGSRFLDPKSMALVGIVGFGNCFCSQLTICAGQVFQAFERLRITATLNLFTNLGRLLAAGSLFLLIRHASARQWAIASTTVTAIICLGAMITVTRNFGWPTFSLKVFFSGLPEGFGYSFATSTASAYNDLDKAMLSHYGAFIANGVYSIAYRVVDVATTPLISIRDAAMPRFFRDGAESLTKSAAFSTSLLKRAVPLSVIASVGMFIAAPLLPIVAGKGYNESVSALRWLCLIPLFRCFHQLYGSALTGAGLQRYRTVSQLSAAALNFGLNLWFIPLFSWRGAAWASLATDGVLGVANFATVYLVGQRLKSTADPYGC